MSASLLTGGDELWRCMHRRLSLLLFCYVLLEIIWLKFFLIWRFFRLWALLDGVGASP